MQSVDNEQPKPANSGFPEEDLRQSGVDNPGYYPVRLGQVFYENGRYVVVRKLGWGKFSSVWLARDHRRVYAIDFVARVLMCPIFSDERFVTLKILTCEGTRALPDDGPTKRSDEVAMLEKVARADPTHRGFRHDLAYYETFDFRGPQGLHRCLVIEALGYGVESLRDEDDRRIHLSIVQHITKQIHLGLEYLHDVCGIVHAGEYHSRDHTDR